MVDSWIYDLHELEVDVSDAGLCRKPLEHDDA